MWHLRCLPSNSETSRLVCQRMGVACREPDGSQVDMRPSLCGQCQCTSAAPLWSSVSLSFEWCYGLSVSVSPRVSMMQSEHLQARDVEVGRWEAEWRLTNGISALSRGGRWELLPCLCPLPGKNTMKRRPSANQVVDLHPNLTFLAPRPPTSSPQNWEKYTSIVDTHPHPWFMVFLQQPKPTDPRDSRKSLAELFPSLSGGSIRAMSVALSNSSLVFPNIPALPTRNMVVLTEFSEEAESTWPGPLRAGGCVRPFLCAQHSLPCLSESKINPSSFSGWILLFTHPRAQLRLQQ